MPNCNCFFDFYAINMHFATKLLTGNIYYNKLYQNSGTNIEVVLRELFKLRKREWKL